MKYLLRMIFSLLVAYCIIGPLFNLLNYGLDGTVIITVLLFIHIFLNLLLYNLKVLKWFLISVGSFSFLSAALMLITDGRIIIPASVEKYFISLYEAVVFGEYITSGMFIPTTILICFGISLLVYILVQKLEAYSIIYMVVFGYFAFLIIASFELSSGYFLLFVFTALLMYFERYFSNKMDEKKMTRGMASIIPSLLVFALVLTSLPYLTSFLKTDPASFIDDIVDEIRSIDFGGRSSRSNSVVSYQTDTAYSQGYSSFDSTLVMVVDASDNFHLRSQSYDFYDGLNWSVSKDLEKREMSVESERNYISMELLENVIGYYSLYNEFMPDLQDLSEDDFFAMAQELFDSVDLWITYGNIRTKAIFAPSNTYSIQFDMNFPVSFDLYSGILSSENTLQKDFSYRVSILAPKTNSSIFRDVLRKGNRLDFLQEAFTPLDLEAYLQLPDDLPDRIRELALSVTEGYDNDYDRIRAIERYLSLNYVYSLDAASTPAGEDFVDHFLFEEQTGYCTYYASAMTIMLRTLGIPARYARGYVMPKKEPMEEMLDDFGQFIGMTELFMPTIYNIYERYAHAWPEAYIRGYGWLAFEPTTTYYSDFVPQGTTDDYYSPVEPPDNIDDETGTAAGSYWILRSMRILLIILILLLPFSPFIYRFFRKFRYSRYDTRKKVLFTFKRTVDLLKLVNYDIMSFETARTYAKRVDSKLSLGDKSFERVIRIFEEARYSNNKINVLDLNIIENYYFSARREVLSYASRIKTAAFYFAGMI